MSTHKHFDKICAVILLFSLLLTLWFMKGEAFGLEKYVDEDAEGYSGNTYFTENDMDGDWSTEGAVEITLQGAEGTINGTGAYFLDGSLVIAKPGNYVLSGELTDGSIIVEAYDTSKIWIMLNGVSVKCSDDACLRVDQADKVFVTLAEGTENTLESGDTFSEEAIADGTGGVIYSHDDLTINGNGSLSIKGGPEHGIEVNDSLVITGGTINIESTSDGIHVNDAFRFDSADLTVSCGDDAVHCDQEILIAGGSILIEKCNEGIEALTVDIQGGDITIYPSDDGINATDGSTSDMPGGFGGGMQQMQTAGEQGTAETRSTTEESVKEQNTAEESSIEQSAAEESSIEQNIAEESEEEQGKDESGDVETEESKTPCVTISGGSVTIINESGMDSDGIDSNGDIRITGGKVLVSLNGNGGNNALDYGSENGGQCFIDGGTVIAAGGSSMLEGISSDSAQSSVTYVLSETTQPDETVKLSDSEGNMLIEESVPCGFSAVILSSADMKQGETYTLEIGETQEEIMVSEIASTYGSSAGGFGMQGGGMRGAGMQSPQGMMNSTESADAEADSAGMQPPQGMINNTESSGEEANFTGMQPPQGITNNTESSGAETGASQDGMLGRQDFGRHGMHQFNEQGQNQETTSATSGTALSEYGSDTRILLTASGIVLLIGLVFAGLFRRRGI